MNFHRIVAGILCLAAAVKAGAVAPHSETLPPSGVPAAEPPAAPDKEATARETLLHFATKMSVALRELGVTKLSDPAVRRARMKELDPLRETILRNGTEAQRREMEKLDGDIEYVARNLAQGNRADLDADALWKFPDAKLNAELGLPAKTSDPTKVTAALAAALQRFTAAVGVAESRRN